MIITNKTMANPRHVSGHSVKAISFTYNMLWWESRKLKAHGTQGAVRDDALAFGKSSSIEQGGSNREFSLMGNSFHIIT